MSRISQEAALDIAIAITKPLADLQEKARKGYQEAVTTAYTNSIPAAVKELVSRNRQYLTFVGTISLHGNGFNSEKVNTGEKVIGNSGNYYAIYEPSAAVAKKLHELCKALDKAKQHYNKVKAETTTALINLRTYKNIKEHLPEAIPFLPTSTTTALVPDLGKLRKEIAAINKPAKAA